MFQAENFSYAVEALRVEMPLGLASSAGLNTHKDVRFLGEQYFIDPCLFHNFLAFSQNCRFFEAAMDTDILTVREVAAYLKIKEKTAYRLAAEGKIPGFKVGGSWRFRQSDIESWIKTQSSQIELGEDER